MQKPSVLLTAAVQTARCRSCSRTQCLVVITAADQQIIMHHSLHQSCIGPSFSITQQPCSLPQQLARCRAQHRPRCHVAAATAAQAYSSTSAAAATTTSSSTALQLRRLQQPQHMYGDMSAQQQSPTTSPDQASGRESKSQKAAGFGGPKNSKSSSSSNGSKQQQQQQQQWATVQLQDNCLCRSGLRYQVSPSCVAFSFTVLTH